MSLPEEFWFHRGVMYFFIGVCVFGMGLCGLLIAWATASTIWHYVDAVKRSLRKDTDA